MICLDSEARHLKQRPFSGLVNKNTGADGNYRGIPDNFRPLCQRRHLQNVKNLQVGVFHSMSKVWPQHICRQLKFSFCYHSEILLAATTGRHSAAAGVTADTRSASFSTGIPKWRDLFKSRLTSCWWWKEFQSILGVRTKRINYFSLAKDAVQPHWRTRVWGSSCWKTGLTYLPQDKMASISQKTFSNVFSWMRMYEFRWRFPWKLFLRFELTIFHHWFR